MIVIDGSILVSPYFEAIVKGLKPTEIVVSRHFKKTVLGEGKLFRILIRFYQADDAIAWSTFEWAKSRIKDWVNVDDKEFAELVARAGTLYGPLFKAFQKSNPDVESSVGYLIADELVLAIGLAAPIIVMGGLQAATWSLIESTFGEAGQCTVLDLSPEEKRKRLQELNLSLAVIAGLDLRLIEVIAALPFAQDYPSAAVSHCRFVAIDP